MNFDCASKQVSSSPLSFSTGSLGTPSNASASAVPDLVPAAQTSPNVDAGEAIAMMLIDNAFARRKTARDGRTSAQSSMAAAQKEELVQMKKEADDKYSAALIGGLTKIGLGAVSLGATGASGIGEVARNGALKTAGDFSSAFLDKGGSKMTEGVTGLWAEGYTRDASTAATAAKRSEHAAIQLKSVAEDWNEDISAAKETVRKALDFLKEYQSTRSQMQLVAGTIKG
jgi:acyl-homoserine lactone acylase PvdQ